MPLELNGYSAYICCDGKEVEAYDVRMDDEKTVSCWIPSEEGKTFTVHWGDTSSATTMRVKVLMDGRRVGSTAHQCKRTGRLIGTNETSDTVRSFIFAPLVLTDDDALLKANVNEDLGIIQIEMTLVQRYTMAETVYGGRHVPEIGPVHERSKKLGVHAVVLGQPHVVSPTRSCNAHGTDKRPFATFKFRYRPLELLQANGIVPLPEKRAKFNKRPLGDLDRAGPSSRKRRHAEPDVKAEAADDGDDDDVEHMQFLEEQLQMMQKRVEDARAARRAKIAVKREISPICIPSSDSDEVIDLT